jgi:nucleoside-triphosphatase
MCAALRKRILLITGPPGIGKTTVLLNVVRSLNKLNFSVGGMLSREIREESARTGFEISSVNGSKLGLLAHTEQKTGPQIGKYKVNLENLNNLGVQSIAEGLERCDIVVIDEIGPMELLSAQFIEITQKALDSNKLVIAVIHYKAKANLISKAKTRKDAQIFRTTFENRDSLHEFIAKKAIEGLIGRAATADSSKQ